MPNFYFPSNDYQLDFFSYDHYFCEMTIYGQPPEYFNSFSESRSNTKTHY